MARKILIIHDIDKYLILIIGPICVLATLFTILTFIKYPSSRKAPGNIILMIAISELILTIHWITSAAYIFFENESPASNGLFC